MNQKVKMQVTIEGRGLSAKVSSPRAVSCLVHAVFLKRFFKNCCQGIKSGDFRCKSRFLPSVENLKIWSERPYLH